jgi:hypothetical protein
MRFIARLAALAAGLAAAAFGQETRPVTAAGPRDPQIDQILREISSANIEASIRKLAAFKTRHTLSTTRDPAIGIGAARSWIKAELERASRAAGGRLQVEFYGMSSPPFPAGSRGRRTAFTSSAATTTRGRSASWTSTLTRPAPTTMPRAPPR